MEFISVQGHHATFVLSVTITSAFACLLASFWWRGTDVVLNLFGAAVIASPFLAARSGCGPCTCATVSLLCYIARAVSAVASGLGWLPVSSGCRLLVARDVLHVVMLNALVNLPMHLHTRLALHILGALSYAVMLGSHTAGQNRSQAKVLLQCMTMMLANAACSCATHALLVVMPRFRQRAQAQAHALQTASTAAGTCFEGSSALSKGCDPLGVLHSSFTYQVQIPQCSALQDECAQACTCQAHKSRQEQGQEQEQQDLFSRPSKGSLISKPWPPTHSSYMTQTPTFHPAAATPQAADTDPPTPSGACISSAPSSTWCSSGTSWAEVGAIAALCPEAASATCQCSGAAAGDATALAAARSLEEQHAICRAASARAQGLEAPSSDDDVEGATAAAVSASAHATREAWGGQGAQATAPAGCVEVQLVGVWGAGGGTQHAWLQDEEDDGWEYHSPFDTLQVSIKLDIPGLMPEHLPEDYLQRLRAFLLESTGGQVLVVSGAAREGCVLVSLDAIILPPGQAGGTALQGGDGGCDDRGDGGSQHHEASGPGDLPLEVGGGGGGGGEEVVGSSQPQGGGHGQKESEGPRDVGGRGGGGGRGGSRKGAARLSCSGTAAEGDRGEHRLLLMGDLEQLLATHTAAVLRLQQAGAGASTAAAAATPQAACPGPASIRAQVGLWPQEQHQAASATGHGASRTTGRGSGAAASAAPAITHCSPRVLCVERPGRVPLWMPATPLPEPTVLPEHTLCVGLLLQPGQELRAYAGSMMGQHEVQPGGTAAAAPASVNGVAMAAVVAPAPPAAVLAVRCGRAYVPASLQVTRFHAVDIHSDEAHTREMGEAWSVQLSIKLPTGMAHSCPLAIELWTGGRLTSVSPAYVAVVEQGSTAAGGASSSSSSSRSRSRSSGTSSQAAPRSAALTTRGMGSGGMGTGDGVAPYGTTVAPDAPTAAGSLVFSNSPLAWAQGAAREFDALAAAPQCSQHSIAAFIRDVGYLAALLTEVEEEEAAAARLRISPPTDPATRAEARTCVWRQQQTLWHRRAAAQQLAASLARFAVRHSMRVVAQGLFDVGSSPAGRLLLGGRHFLDEVPGAAGSIANAAAASESEGMVRDVAWWVRAQGTPGQMRSGGARGGGREGEGGGTCAHAGTDGGDGAGRASGTGGAGGISRAGARAPGGLLQLHQQLQCTLPSSPLHQLQQPAHLTQQQQRRQRQQGQQGQAQAQGQLELEQQQQQAQHGQGQEGLVCAVQGSESAAAAPAPPPAAHTHTTTSADSAPPPQLRPSTAAGTSSTCCDDGAGGSCSGALQSPAVLAACVSPLHAAAVSVARQGLGGAVYAACVGSFPDQGLEQLYCAHQAVRCGTLSAVLLAARSCALAQLFATARPNISVRSAVTFGACQLPLLLAAAGCMLQGQGSKSLFLLEASVTLMMWAHAVTSAAVTVGLIQLPAPAWLAHCQKHVQLGQSLLYVMAISCLQAYTDNLRARAIIAHGLGAAGIQLFASLGLGMHLKLAMIGALRVILHLAVPAIALEVWRRRAFMHVLLMTASGAALEVARLKQVPSTAQGMEENSCGYSQR